MTNTKLSHSQIQRYQQCPKSYYYHYIKRFRPASTTGALLFGDALDKALNCLLLNEGDAYTKFIETFTYGEINKVKEYLPTSEKLVYAKTDYDADLLTEEDIEEINTAIGAGKNFDYETVLDKKNAYGITGDELRFFNHVNWTCLTKKAKYILDGYKKKILPKIKRVISIQEAIEVDNGAGDKLIGFIDMVAELEDHGVVIIDHKTSARDYEDDAVLHSAQLILYTHILSEKYNTNKAGFIVMKKAMKKDKKCSVCGYKGEGTHKTCNAMMEAPALVYNVPGATRLERCNGKWDKSLSASFQIIVDEVPQKSQDLVIENVDEVNKCIKSGLFPRNLDHCTNHYGGKCPFYNLCHKDSMEGLIESEPRVTDEKV